VSRRLAASLAVLAAAGLGLAALLPRPSPPPPPLAWAVCGAPVHDLELELTGELILHRDLAPADLPRAFLEQAVALQVRHAFAASHNDAGHTAILVPDGPPRALEILARSDAAYPHALVIDWPADPGLAPESDYVRRAVARGTLAAGDPALRIAWRAAVRLAACEPDVAVADGFDLPAPRDPFLLHWTVPAERRVEHTYIHKRLLGFPCADPDVADTPHPEYLWYYWQPRRPGCEALLTARELGAVHVRVRERRRPGADLGPWRDALAAALGERPLRVVLVFGYLNHQVARPDPERLREAVRADLDPDVEIEWGTAQYLKFVRGTADLLADRTLALPRDGEPAAEVRGLLRRSGRRVELTAHLTETDYLAPPELAPRHAPILVDALATADAIVYAGHSGLGLNFSRARLEQDTTPAAVAAALAASPARLLGFIGCYTYTYFGDDLAAGLPRPRDALFVYTGNSVVETADSALHVLHALDCLLAGAASPRACELAPPGQPGAHDFLIFDPPR
jgi:hypothetical protein